MKLNKENCPIEVKTKDIMGKLATNPARSNLFREKTKVFSLLRYFMISITDKVNAAKNITNGNTKITIGIC
jgi:hypothetical protein